MLFFRTSNNTWCLLRVIKKREAVHKVGVEVHLLQWDSQFDPTYRRCRRAEHNSTIIPDAEKTTPKCN